jgi:hypothetical protein
MHACAVLQAPEEAAAHAAWIRKFEGDISAAPLVLVDANLDAASVALVAEMASGAGVPVWFEPVSVTKAVRGACCLRHLAIVSPNQAELRAMSLAAGYRPAASFGKFPETFNLCYCFCPSLLSPFNPYLILTLCRKAEIWLGLRFSRNKRRKRTV